MYDNTLDDDILQHSISSSNKFRVLINLFHDFDVFDKQKISGCAKLFVIIYIYTILVVYHSFAYIGIQIFLFY